MSVGYATARARYLGVVRRWTLPALLLVIGLMVSGGGYLLADRASAFPGPVKKVDATVLDNRAASCAWHVPRVRVRFELQGNERIAELSENDCAPLRTTGETIRVYVLTDWPQYVGSCRYCLPVDADDAPEMYLYELRGPGLLGLGFFPVVAGLVLFAVRARSARWLTKPAR